jgi:hypothetical protein
MKMLNVLELLNNYKGWVEKGKIQFLQSNSPEQQNILHLLDDFISDFAVALEKGDLSSNLDWQVAHQKGRGLWQNLASYALNDIDSDSKGNSELFEYLDAAAKFEELLYGLEEYYRDHTLHSLWVYFIGEHILRDLLPEMHNNLNWYLFNDIEREKKQYSPKLVIESKNKEKALCKDVNKNRDAIWCIMALCHDLGYSLAKLDNLNEKVKNVLKFFDIPHFRHLGYSLDIEHHYIVAQFLELMAMDVRMVPSTDRKDVLIKCYRDDSTYWRLSRALEKKQHGILSAYLIYKILGIFADAWIRGPAEEWGLDDKEAFDNIVRGDILFAIAQHEFDFAHLNQIGSLADILILADELEEFSRYGRQMLTRKYYDTTAEAGISFNKIKNKKEIEIVIKYEVAEHYSINKFFKRKAEKLCKFYSLGQDLDENPTIAIVYRIKSIKMVTVQNGEEYFVHFFKDTNNNIAYLPATTIHGKKQPKGKYRIKCHDDIIDVIFNKNKEISLGKWLENVK